MTHKTRKMLAAVGLTVVGSFGMAEAASATPKVLVPRIATKPAAFPARNAAQAVTAAPQRVTGTRVIIPSIGLNRPVVVGKQSAIDAGNVVNYTGKWPGSGTVYLAGHNSSHGAVFRNVSKLQVGATVTLWRDGKQYTYKIVSKQIISLKTKLSAVNWGDLVLQTCKNSSQAYLLRAQLVSVS